MSFKDYIEEIILLPLPVKIGACVFAGILILSLIYAGLSNYALSKKAEKLEKANVELQSEIEAAAKRATVAETNAENERLRADNLESQIQPLNSQGQKQDEQIIVQKQSTADIRRRLDSIRSRKYIRPKSGTDTNAAASNDDREVTDTQKRLADRYERERNGNNQP